ncbi:MAG: hypothetical protein QOF42_2061, partial [Gammaproteobacteria bacterium]|nr:hypothetical protein [Gammaproteobacteria bacterium]
RKELRKQIVSRREILFHDLTPVRALEKCLTEEIARSRASVRA